MRMSHDYYYCHCHWFHLLFSMVMIIHSCCYAVFVPSSSPLSLSSSWLQQQQQQRLLVSSSRIILHQTSNANNDHMDHENNVAATTTTAAANERNDRYVQGLLENLTLLLDKYVMNGSPKIKASIENLYLQIQTNTRNNNNPEAFEKAKRQIRSAGINIPAEKENTNKDIRLQQATERKQWEETFRKTASEIQNNINTENKEEQPQYRSALGAREPDDANDNNTNTNQQQQQKPNFLTFQKNLAKERVVVTFPTEEEIAATAAEQVSEYVAQSAPIFSGDALGIGGLDDVLNTLKRRVWIPLAAPPQLLQELGIVPVRGVLLYGRPGCGKTLLAQKLGNLLSPLRPITVVSGPEIMDKYVGSSEMKLREIFDNPPEIHERFRKLENAPALAKAALHVVIMDEFDAIARHRGGRDGAGDQGDAGVARDSVVNQLLSKMDGVAPLEVPTLVIGLTNKRSLIDAALLRPGRFEVQIEVPPPRTIAQRKSILRVHTRHMQNAGRLLVSDAPKGTAAANRTMTCVQELPTYDELLQRLAEETDGFSGASLAAMARAAASHALERSVEELTKNNPEESHKLLQECIVTIDDFEEAKSDFNNVGNDDYSDDPETGDVEDLVSTTSDDAEEQVANGAGYG